MDDLIGAFNTPPRPSTSSGSPINPLHKLQTSHRRTHSQQPSPSATTFDDLLGLSPIPGVPAPRALTNLQRPRLPQHRPSSYQGPLRPSPLLTPITPANLVDDSSSDDDFGDFISTPDAFSVPAKPNKLRKYPPAQPPAQRDEFPPVAALLAAFPTLFNLPERCLLARLKGLPFELRQRVLADPKTKTFLRGICELGRVAARIIAGRKRWAKVALGSHDAAKEEREVKETLRLWAELVPRLRAALGGAVPEVDEGFKVSARGQGEVCRLCKLTRTEIMLSLREETSAPGWWDGSWGGHGGCRGFWDRHGAEVRSRRY